MEVRSRKKEESVESKKREENMGGGECRGKGRQGKRRWKNKVKEEEA